MKKSILIIENDLQAVAVLKDILESEGFSTLVRHDGSAGYNTATSGQCFDLIIIAVKLPGMDGFSLLKKLRSTHVTPVVMLTSSDSQYERIFGLELGADDLISKPFDPYELLARIRAIFRRIQFGRNTWIYAELKNGKFKLNSIEGCLLYDNHLVGLTATEFSILQLLFQNLGAVVSKAQISECVFNKTLQPYDRTIDMHVSNLRKKFSQHSHNECIRTIRGCGYQMTAL